MAGIFVHLSGGLGPDGLATDREGRLAIVQAQAGRAYLVDALGDLLAVLRTPGGLWTTACTFSPDHADLIVVEAQTGGLYRLDVATLTQPHASGHRP